MLRLLNARLVRSAIAVAIVAVLGSVALERAVYQTSIEAVVNAPRLDVIAPVDGVVEGTPIGVGQAVAAGAPVAQLRVATWSQGTEGGAGHRARILRERIGALDAQRRTLRGLRDSLLGRASAFRRATIAQLTAQLEAARLRVVERDAALRRLVELAPVAGASPQDLERGRSELAAAQASLEELREAVAAASRGVVTSQGAQDVPYSQQRADEVALQLAAIGPQLAAARAELRAVAPGAEWAGTDASPSVVTVPSAVAGVLWSLAAAPGEYVLRGARLATLVDCSRRFLEATIPPRDQGAIVPGRPVRLRFAGSRDAVEGRVAWVRGGALPEDDHTIARLTLSSSRNDSRVGIELLAGPESAAAGTFCDVGRSAKVYFSGPGEGILGALTGWTRGDAPTADRGALASARPSR